MATITLEPSPTVTPARTRAGRPVATVFPRTPSFAQQPSAMVPGQVRRSAVRGGCGAGQAAVEITQRGLAVFIGTTSLVCGLSLYTIIVQIIGS